jgi:mono/diheme cytochrome c family protein
MTCSKRLALSLFAFSLALDATAWSQESDATKDTIAKIQASGASLQPLSAQSKDQYRFTALNVAKTFNDEKLSMLAPLANQIVELDLAKTQVTDAGLEQLASMKQLKELHLENTAITDAGLAKLATLLELEYLNLYGTKVTDAGLKSLGVLTKLKKLYLWQTAVTKAGVVDLRKVLASTQINSGWTKEDAAKVVAVVATAAPAPAKELKSIASPTKAPAKVTTPPVAAPVVAATTKLDEAVAEKTLIFKDLIMPIVSEKCVACHGEKKSKGKLKMHTYADIMKGGSEGDVNVIAGKPADSLFLKRVALPEDDDEHMPPSDEKQLSKEEVQLVTWWIQEGASESLNVKAAKRSPEIEAILAALLKSGSTTAPALKKPVAHAEKISAKAEKGKPAPLTEAEKKTIADITQLLSASQAVLMPISQDTPLLRLSTVNAAAAFGDKELALLAPIASRIAILDVARTQLTDDGLSVLKQFTALERIHLENTKVTDAALVHLAGLKSLEYLNLYGTKVTDAGVAVLGSCAALRKLYVWQTAVSADAAKALEAKISGLKVYLGLTDADIAKITAVSKAVQLPKPKNKKAKKLRNEN